jgi:hypothetical protein
MGQLSHSHDQAIRLDKATLKQATEEVEEKIEQSLVDGTPDIALAFGNELVLTGQLRGVQLSHLLYSLKEVWSSFITDDDIEDTVLKDMGIEGPKFRKYVDLWEYVFKPHPKMIGKPWQGLEGILYAARIDAFTDEDWEELEKAHDWRAMTDIRRKRLGVQTKGSVAVTIGWERDGYVIAYQQGEEPETLGNLKRVAETKHGQTALNRIMREDRGVLLR